MPRFVQGSMPIYAKVCMYVLADSKVLLSKGKHCFLEFNAMFGKTNNGKQVRQSQEWATRTRTSHSKDIAYFLGKVRSEGGLTKCGTRACDMLEYCGQ